MGAAPQGACRGSPPYTWIMKFASRIVLLAAIATTLALPQASWAARRGGWHGGWHRPHGHVVFFVGAPAYFYGVPAYYYAPPYAVPQPPTVYIEKYPGVPTPGTQELFMCPATGQYYPDAQECAGGWARVIENRAPAVPGSSG